MMEQNLSLYDQKILFAQIAEGNVTAFRELFDAYRMRLYAAAYRITKSSYAAEEIVQEIFTGIWESRSALSEVDNPPAYIFTVAYNQSFRYLREIAADTRLYQSLISRAKRPHNETEEWLEVKETQELIDHVIEEVPPQRKLIYKLSREDGLTHRQIAEQLKISPLTVKKQIVLALRSIRTGLAGTAPVMAFFFCWFR